MVNLKKYISVFAISLLLFGLSINLFCENIHEKVMNKAKWKTVENPSQNDSKKYIHYFNIFHF